MHRFNQFAYANFVQVQVDVLFLILTFGMAYLTASRLTSLGAITEYLWILTIFIPLWVFIMALRGMYHKMTFYYLDRVFRNVFLATFFSGMCLGNLFYFSKDVSTSRILIVVFIVLCVLIMFLERGMIGLINQRANGNRQAPRIILVCSSETLLMFQHYLKRTQIRYNTIGVVQVGEGDRIQTERNLGGLEDLDYILKNQIVDEVVLAFPKDYDGGVEQYVRMLCEQMGITVHLIFNPYDLKHAHVRITMLGPLPMLTFHTVNLNPVQRGIKRGMDICGAIVGIAFTLVVAVGIVPAIILDSRGPIIFKQTRVGRYGREFDFYKFRTMRVDVEFQKEELQAMNEHKDGLMFKIKEDPRVTRVGDFLRKTSLDELPQFFNVLKGNMSLVGTRPPTLDEVELYHVDHLRRISIKPGLTGMWQVNGRSDIMDFDEVVALDVYYIDNWSVWLDIGIMFKTLGQVWSRKSAY